MLWQLEFSLKIISSLIWLAECLEKWLKTRCNYLQEKNQKSKHIFCWSNTQFICNISSHISMFWGILVTLFQFETKWQWFSSNNWIINNIYYIWFLLYLFRVEKNFWIFANFTIINEILVMSCHQFIGNQCQESNELTQTFRFQNDYELVKSYQGDIGLLNLGKQHPLG